MCGPVYLARSHAHETALAAGQDESDISPLCIQELGHKQVHCALPHLEANPNDGFFLGIRTGS